MNSWIQKLVFFIGFSLIGVVSIWAESTILESDFSGTSPSENLPWTNVSVQSNSLSFSGWTMGAGCSSATNNDEFVFTVDSDSSTSTVSQAIEAATYLSFMIEPTGDALNLNALQMNMTFSRMSLHAPRCFAVFTSEDGFEAGDEIFTSNAYDADNYDPLELSFFFPDSGFENIDDELEIRIVCFMAQYDFKYIALQEFSLVSDVETFDLSLASESGGTVSATDNMLVFEVGESTELTADPDDGYRFAGWSGDLTGLGNPRTLTMDSDKSVTALFEALSETNRMEVGTNLNSINDWSDSFVFKDLMMRMRSLMTRNQDGSGDWSSGYASDIETDENGWPLQCPIFPEDGTTQIIHTILVDANDAGDYTFSFEGTGSFYLTVEGSSSVTFTGDGTVQTSAVTMERQGLVGITFYTSDVDDPLRNFHMVPNEYLDDYKSDPFDPTFLERSGGYKVLRFMDWGATNGSDLEDWADRTTTNHFTQSRSNGAAIEFMVDLSNRHNSDAWICIPHQANDNYVRQAAQLICDTLNTNQKVYVEYSNETWNGIFDQYDYTGEQGMALGLSESEWLAASYYTSMRSARIWEIFEEVYGDESSSRVVKVLATQSANSTVTGWRIDALNDPTINTNQVFPDALAIAPYFNKAYSSSDIPPETDDYPTVDEILGSDATTCISNAQINVQAQKAIADTQGLDLICYEGGQHFTDSSDDDTMCDLLTEANRDPGMYACYTDYFDMLEEEGVSLMVYFSLCGSWNDSGSCWGALEVIDQSEATAFKYMAIQDWMTENLDGGNVLKITDWSLDDSQISWRSKPTHSYAIQCSTNLQSWTTVSNSIYTESMYSTNGLILDEADTCFLRMLDEE